MTRMILVLLSLSLLGCTTTKSKKVASAPPKNPHLKIANSYARDGLLKEAIMKYKKKSTKFVYESFLVSFKDN